MDKVMEEQSNELFEDVSITGLTDDEAKKRLVKYGLNSVSQKKNSPYFRMFYKQFADFLIFFVGFR